MSAIPCNPCAPSPAVGSAADNEEHEIPPPTPSSSVVPGAPPLTQPRPPHTPPSSSNAQLLAGMNPTITSFLSGLSTHSTSPMPEIPGAVTQLELPTTGGYDIDEQKCHSIWGAARADLSAATSASDRVLLGIYNNKLQASVRSIITTLTAELPQDHIFLQLLADPMTLQYCKVRLAEVVEGFLYSTQAEQYHELATDFARCERDCALLHQRVKELEAALATANGSLRLSTPQPQGLSPPRTTSIIGDSHAHQSTATAPITSSISTSTAANPMESEEARRELLRILEQATHDQELHRCSQALQAVSKVVRVAREEPAYDDKYLFEGDLLGELYKCVQALLHYIDAALESQQRLRCEIQEQQLSLWYGAAAAAAADSRKPPDANVLGGSAVITSRSASVSNVRNIQGDSGLPLSSSNSTPRRPQVSLGHLSAGRTSSAADRRSSSASSPVDVDHTREIQEQRGRLQQLANQLREGQQHARQILETLAQVESSQRRSIAQLERAVASAREEADDAMRVAEEAQTCQKNSDRLCAEHAASIASEKTALRDQLADAHAQLATAIQDAHAARRELSNATNRAASVKEREKDLSTELTVLKAALKRRDAEAEQQKVDRIAWQAELTALKAEHQSNIDALQDAARELLCLRVERTMAALSAAYQEAKVAKAELLKREAYEPFSLLCSTALVEEREAARHAQVQSQLAESAQAEQAATRSKCIDALGVLLRSMWADDAIESTTTALLASTGASDAVVAHSTHNDGPGKATREVGAINDRFSGSDSSAPTSNIEIPDAANTRGSHIYRLPSTLPGLCTSLEDAYKKIRAHHRARQQTIDSLRAALVSKDIELRAAQASEVQLRELVKAEQAKDKQWKMEMAQLGEHNPLRGLLARQELLLKAVSEERDELRRLWTQLSSDYIALEQRNGTLHARCAEKEHENTRLSGILRRRSATATSTSTSSRVYGAEELIRSADK